MIAEKWIVVATWPDSGDTYYGPFDGPLLAEEWATRQLGALRNQSWCKSWNIEVLEEAT